MHFAVFQSLLLVLSDRNPKADCSSRPSYRGAVSVLHFCLEKVTYIFTLLWYGKLAGENTSRRPTSQRKFTLFIVCGIPPRLCCNVQLEGRLNAGSEFSPLDNRGCDEPNHTKIVKLSPENISYQKKSHQQQCRFAIVCFRV